MNLRYAATLALMGWYLLVPPTVGPYLRLDLRVPVSQWKVVQRFDMPTACEGYLQEMKEDPEAEGLQKLRNMGIPMSALTVARCIFSDVRTSNEK